MLIKNHWKAFGMASLLLAASCSEDDAPTATTPDAKDTSDSTAVVTPDALKETLLLNFHAIGNYLEEDEEPEQQYVIISDQQGKPLVAESFRQGDERAITIPTSFTDEEIQVTVLYKAPSEEATSSESTVALSFLDVARGADWEINTYEGYSGRPESVGDASLEFDNIDERAHYDGFLEVIDGYTSIENRQINDTLRVPLYRNPSPVGVFLEKDGQQYAGKVDLLRVGEHYSVDTKLLTAFTDKIIADPAGDYDRLVVSVEGAYALPNSFKANNRLDISYFDRGDDSGSTTLHYPGDVFPAYESVYQIRRGNDEYRVTRRGPVSDQFLTPGFSATINDASAGNFSMDTQGAFGFSQAWWEYDGQEAVQWIVLGSPETSAYQLPQLPDSIFTLDVKKMNCSRLSLANYSNVKSYADLLKELHATGDINRTSELEESIFFNFEDPNADNGRTLQNGFTSPFMMIR